MLLEALLCYKLHGKCIISYQQIYFTVVLDSVGDVFSVQLLFCRDNNHCFGPSSAGSPDASETKKNKNSWEALWESLKSREIE